MKATVVTLVVALVGVIAFSVIGQEEPLPVVIPKAQVDSGVVEMRLASPTIVLAAEPIQEYQPPTLIDAARHNDYITFDALYTAAKRRGDEVSQFETLHELWTYAVTDPIGAFYGRDIYDRLARAYPGYPRYIEQYVIIDSRGNAYYPTSETRAFLLDRVIEGRAPRVQIAERARTEEDESQPLAAVRAKAPATAAAKKVVNRAVAPAPKRDVVVESAPIEKPIVVAEAPQEPIVIQATPEVEKPAAIEPTPAPAPAPAVAIPQTAQEQQNPLARRGILLMIIGLIGIGLLAVILRTPKDEMATIITKPTGNVEPIRKPPPSQDDSRATGSHG